MFVLKGKMSCAFLFFKICIFWFSPFGEHDLCSFFVVVVVLFCFAFLLHLFIWEEVRDYTCMCVESEDDFLLLPSCGSLLLSCGSQGLKSGIRLGRKCRHPLSHLWQAGQEHHKFETNLDNTTGHYLQKYLGRSNMHSSVNRTKIWGG